MDKASDPPLTMPLQAVERLVNKALATDPEFVEALAKYHGRAIHVVPQGLSGSLRVQLAGHGVELRWFPAASGIGSEDDVLPAGPDVELSGPVLALGALLKSVQDKGSALPAGVEVKGDLGLLDDLRQLAAKLSIDWEELLAQRVGDVVAHQVWRAAGDLRQWSSDAARSLSRSTSEWLRYETGAAVSQEEISGFVKDVDNARDYLARLEARIAILERQQNRSDEGPRT